MSIIRSTRAMLLAAVLVTACDDGRVGDAPEGADQDRPRGEYTREMIFVAEDATGAALFDFVATDVGSAVRRSARGWAESGSGWTPLYDLSWDGTPMRLPWRLVPQGPLRLRVGLNDEVEAVIVREEGEDVAVLEQGDFVAAWTPHNAAQVVLREASLTLGAEPIVGWLVDARFGVTEAAEAAEDEQPAEEQPVEDAASAAEIAQADSVDADSVTFDSLEQGVPAPARMQVRSVRALLVADDGLTLVIGETGTGMAGWLYADGAERMLPIITLTRTQGERESWAIEAGGGDTLSGSLTVMDEEPMPVSPRIVRGTVTIGEDEIDMHGVLRPAVQ